MNDRLLTASVPDDWRELHVHMGGGVHTPAAQGMSADERRAAQSLLQALEVFLDLRGDLPAQLIASFLRVVIREGLSVSDYSRQAIVSKSVMSNHLNELGEKSRRPGAEGMGLLAQRMAPDELRRHEVTLTPRGRAVRDRVLRAWQLGCG